MDIYGNEHPLAYPYYPIGRACGDGEAISYNWPTAAVLADPLNYGMYWYACNTGSSSMLWDPAAYRSAYEYHTSPQAWTNENYNAQRPIADNQQTNFGSENQSKPLPMVPTSAYEYNNNNHSLSEYDVKYQPDPMLPTTADGHNNNTLECEVKYQPPGSVPQSYTDFSSFSDDVNHLIVDNATVNAVYAAYTPPLTPFVDLEMEPAPSSPFTIDLARSETPVPSSAVTLAQATYVIGQGLGQEESAEITKKPLKVKHAAKRSRWDELRTEWSCEVCNKYFIRRNGLQQHNAIKHAGDRPFGCSKCGKRYANEAQLELHAQRHRSTDKPFKCAICPKQFFYRMDLVRHGYKHTGDTPHVCSQCSKAFTRHDHLRRHELIHEASMLIAEPY